MMILPMKKILAGLLMLAAVPVAHSQELWTSADFSAGFGKKWEVGAEVEYRTHDALKSTERVTIGLSGEYKQKYFKIDAGYKYIMSHTLEEETRKGNIIPPYWIGRHRVYASVTGKIKAGRFSLSLRERYQYTHRLGKWVEKYEPDGETRKDDEWIAPKDKHILRSRLHCDYNIRKSKFEPFASIELYDNLSRQFSVEKVRYTIGSEYKINKHNRVELFYRFVQGVEAGTDNQNVIGVGYTFRL